MSDINTIKTKLDTDNQKWVISEKEFNDNFGKLDQTDYKKISEWLEAKDQQFLTLLQKPIFENLQKKDLLNKQSLSVNEIKTVKLFFISYGMNANRSVERQKSNDQKIAEMYMNQKGIWYWLWQDWWNEFKKWFKWNMFNFDKSKGKDINYPAWPINMNHQDIKRLNDEWLQITQQIEKVQKDNYNKIQQGIKDIENKEIATRPLSKKLEELKNGNTLDVLDELTSVPDWILYDDNITEMTYNEQQKIQKIIENVFSNPSVNSTQVMDYVWYFLCSLSDEKWSNKTWKKVEWSNLPILVDNQVGMRVEIMNSCYQLSQAKCFWELQSKPETAKRSLIKLCNILTWRFNSTGKGRDMQEDNDKKFNNPELARGILENLMQINGTIDKISPVDVLKDEPSLKNKECWSFVAEISQNIPRPLSWEFGILDLVSVDEKTQVSDLSPTLQARAIVLKKISEKIKSDDKQAPFESAYIQELKNFWIKLAKEQQAVFEVQKGNFKEEIKKAGRYTTSGFEKSAQEYWLQWADIDIFNLYRDSAVNSFWAGQLSDEMDDKIMEYGKMAYMIGGTVMAMMIFPPAWVWYLWSAVAVWVTSTVLTQVLYNKMNYNSFAEWAVDIWSQFVFDTATAFLGMKVFWPIIQKVPWFLNQAKTMAGNFWLTIFDASIWAWVEWIRQVWVNELFDRQQEVDILQMIKAWWVMATVFLMVSWWFHAKLPIDDMIKHLRANDPKLNPTGFKNLKISEVDYHNSIKLLELKSNALKDIDIPNQKVKNNIQPETKQKYSQNEIETNPENIKYYNQIPIEKNKYYRVTWQSEIDAIISKEKLEAPKVSFYDRQILKEIEKNSKHTLQELEKLNWIDNNKKLRELYEDFVAKPKREKGEIILAPRTKSNHGDIGFSKEGFFYDVNNKSSWYYGAPVIVGNNSSKFESWHHGSYKNIFNDEIKSWAPVVLREWFNAKDFEYWFYEKNKGWYKVDFETLKNQNNQKSIKNFSDMSYDELEVLHNQAVSKEIELWKYLKGWKLAKEQYISEIQKIRDNSPTFDDLSKAKYNDVIQKYGYQIPKENIKTYIYKLWMNIQWWGNNAKWVHLIEGTNLVAVIKSEWSFIYELPQRTLMQNINSPRVPKVIDVFIHEGKTYKVMEKSPGKSLESLYSEELSNIPQEHYNNYVRDIIEIENNGLKIDPSKASNVFYDKETWFHFIDLGVKESSFSMFDNAKNLQLGQWILDWEKIRIAKENIKKQKNIEKKQV